MNSASQPEPTKASVPAKSLKSVLWSTSVLRLFDNGIRVASVLLVSPLIIKGIGVHDYGLWVLVLAWVGWMEMLDLGMANTAARHFGQAVAKKDTFELAGLWMTFRHHYNRVAIASLTITGLGVIGIYLWTGKGESLTPVWLFALLGTAQGLVLFQRVYPALLKGYLEYHSLILVGGVRTIVHALAICCVPQRWLTLEILAALHVVLLFSEQGALRLLAGRLVPRLQRPPLSNQQNREIKKFAAKNMVATIAYFFRDRIDTQLLASYVSLQAVSQYAVGVRFPNLVIDVCNSLFGGHLMSGFTSAAVGKEARDLLKGFMAVLRLSTCVGLSAAVALYFLGPPFILRWLGAEFEEAGTVLRILVPGVSLTVMQYPVLSLLPALNKHGALAVAYLCTAFLNLVLSWFLVTRIGLPGVVWATTIELSVQALVILPLLVRRVLPVSPVKYLVNAILRPSVLFCAVTIPFSVWWMAAFRPDTYVGLAEAACAIGAVSGVACWFLILSQADRKFVISQLPKARRRSGPIT